MAKKRGNGEGSISRRKNGGWMAQYAVYTAEGRKRKTLYGKTRAVVAEKLTKAMADRDGGLIFDAGKLTVGEYLERWLADSVKGSVKEATYANYGHFARKHICPALGRLKLKNLTPAHVRSFYGEKSRSGLSAATVKKMHVVLHRALSQAVTDGLIPRNAAHGVRTPQVGDPGEEINTKYVCIMTHYAKDDKAYAAPEFRTVGEPLPQSPRSGLTQPLPDPLAR